MSEQHSGVLVSRTPAAIEGVSVYTVLVIRDGLEEERTSKALADRDPANIVTTIGELVFAGLEALDES